MCDADFAVLNFRNASQAGGHIGRSRVNGKGSLPNAWLDRVLRGQASGSKPASRSGCRWCEAA
jgi:hypothetical protein